MPVISNYIKSQEQNCVTVAANSSLFVTFVAL